MFPLLSAPVQECLRYPLTTNSCIVILERISTTSSDKIKKPWVQFIIKILLIENECKTPRGCLTFFFYQKYFLWGFFVLMRRHDHRDIEIVNHYENFSLLLNTLFYYQNTEISNLLEMLLNKTNTFFPSSCILWSSNNEVGELADTASTSLLLHHPLALYKYS